MKFTKLIQGPLVVVTLGVLLGIFFATNPSLAITTEHMVSVPVASSVNGFFDNFSMPDFANGLKNPEVYITAVVIAVVASLETLLCVEASDKQDDLKRITPTNRELKAQGIGNLIAGFIGGLPVTQVIVRSSANQQSGGKTKASTIMHGVLLLVSVVTIPTILNKIPLGVLAAILLVVGYKLAKPALFKKMYKQGWGQFIPFVVTVTGIVFTDLLMGIALGLVVAVFVILRNNYRIPYEMTRESLEGRDSLKILLSEDVTFLNKASIQNSLTEIPDNTRVTIDASANRFIHHDVIEIIEDFQTSAGSRNIEVEVLYLDKTQSENPVQRHKLSKN